MTVLRNLIAISLYGLYALATTIAYVVAFLVLPIAALAAAAHFGLCTQDTAAAIWLVGSCLIVVILSLAAPRRRYGYFEED